MGAILSKVIDAQNGGEKALQANDVLNSLNELTQTKLDLFYNQVTNTHFDDNLLPIHKVIARESWIYAQTEDSPLNVSAIIDTTARSFANGETANGVGTIIQSVLNTAFGVSRASTQSKKIYAISVGDLAGIQRVDIDIFAYQFTSQALTNITRGVQGATVVLSSVNTTGLDKNDLRVIVQATFASVPIEQQQAILDQLFKAYDEQRLVTNETRDNLGVTPNSLSKTGANLPRLEQEGALSPSRLSPSQI
ncbi:MAG: hypothetical protein M1831_002590 [Alyxoria varia]|nr:MAG: hypothetical protein M1831_002590 [Alyxoria varia]